MGRKKFRTSSYHFAKRSSHVEWLTPLIFRSAVGKSRPARARGVFDRNLVDPASSHMLAPKTKPCMSQSKLSHNGTANGSLKQL